MMEDNECFTEQCSIEQCDIFDFMANNVGMTVIHPGGFNATDRLAESCHIDKDSKVIDIGCGKGTTAVRFAKKYGCNVIGIDLREDLVAQANSLAKRKRLGDLVTFQVADALDIPFSNEEFDIAISQAVLILVSDKKKAIQEALRVVKTGGHVGWLELSWRKTPTEEFLSGVSNVICAYCMLGVETFKDWEHTFSEAGANQLETLAFTQKFGGLRSMLADEGILNAIGIMYRYLTNSKIRKRMKIIDRFFKEYEEYFGYGIYIGQK